MKKDSRLGLESYNNQGCLMKIIEYNNANDIFVEFQDNHKAIINTRYSHFANGVIKNPYFPDVFGVGMLGSKYPAWENGKATKEYATWKRILQRCFDKNYQEKQPTYKNAVCCEEWLLYDNFYEWLHKQKNFKKWLNNERWALDKDILIKGNKVYSPETCCLVPQNVNSLFTKCNIARGDTFIGVHEQEGKFLALCNNPLINKQEYLGSYSIQEQAFQIYKEHKENIIKQVAQIEFNANNITKECYNAMIKYEVEITD